MSVTELIFSIIGAAISTATITITVLGIMLKRSEKRGANGNRLDTVEKRMDGLRCGEHILSVNSIHIDMEAMRGDIRMMMSHMGISKNSGYTARKSPMHLTQKGEEFVKEHSLDSMISKNWKYINGLISSNQLTTAYDIDKFCLDQAIMNTEQFFSDDDLLKLKGIAFLRGEKLESYAGMVAVIVRNRYFSENGIPVDDIKNVTAENAYA